MHHNFLRRLELQGFKSFAGKTTLEFPSRVTAVVGPNGSGKSNVIDALRWVLGEREAKQLRGDTIGNLIFGGTPKRPAVSLAKVSLLFDNRDRQFPVDAPEVELSRRVDRSGSSEFFLHDSEVKLKDLSPMLARARLGSRGLTMIGQGQSDLFVRSSPIERRGMIEEILGLREFRIKKTQAERRLETSSSNAEKARALLDEIGPHLKLLRRQKQRWDKRSEIESELRTLEDGYFAIRYRSLQALIHTSDSPVPALEAAIIKQRAEITAGSAEVAAAEAASFDVDAVNKIRRDINNAFNERSQLVVKLAHLEARREAQDSREVRHAVAANPGEFLESLRERITEALSAPTIEAVRAILSDVPERIRTFLKPVTKYEEPVHKSEPSSEEKEIINLIAQLDDRITALRADEEKLAKGQEEARRAFKDRIEALEEKKNALRDLESKLQAARFEEEKVRFKIEDLEGDWRALGRNVAELSELRAPLEGDFDLNEAERRMPRLRGELAAIGDIDEGTIREADETERRHEFLTKELTDLEAASADLRTLIHELDERIHHDFKAAFKAINEAFNEHFVLMFGGGKAHLSLEKPEPKSILGNVEGEIPIESTNPSEDPELSAGVEIELSIPRKRITSLDMLSGGEKSLVSLAALFALISVSPPPFLVLDEIDAPLDEENARKFSDLVKSFSGKTQFIIVTHNRATMEAADVLYGVTMGDDGVSKVLSLKLG